MGNIVERKFNQNKKQWVNGTMNNTMLKHDLPLLKHVKYK